MHSKKLFFYRQAIFLIKLSCKMKSHPLDLSNPDISSLETKLEYQLDGAGDCHILILQTAAGLPQKGL